MRSRSQQRGFTLIELMVTVAIMAILAAIAYPSFTDLIARNRLKGATEGLFADLEYAKSEAIKLNQTVTLEVTTGASWNYTIKDAGGNKLKTVNSGEFRDVNLSGATNASLSITPLQGETNGTTVTFQRASNTAQTMSVVVSTRGRIKICTSSSVLGYKPCS